MPTGKDLKRLVRARMKKTGESYTAARAQLLKKKKTATNTGYAEVAGMSDASLREATGCNWERWVRTLDRAGRRDEIASRDREARRVFRYAELVDADGHRRLRADSRSAREGSTT
jgi:hypothetical protein